MDNNVEIKLSSLIFLNLKCAFFFLNFACSTFVVAAETPFVIIIIIHIKDY